MATTATVLTATEQERLASCEQTIERGLTGFVETGEALMRIRDERLYRATHPTFEDYCRERWEMDRRNANRHIEAAQIADALGSNDPIPNVAVARELAPLKSEPDQMRAAWEKAQEAESNGKPPTAKVVRQAVREVASPQPAQSVPQPSREELTRNRAWGIVRRIEEELEKLEALDRTVITSGTTSTGIQKMQKKMTDVASALIDYAQTLGDQ